MLLKVAAELEKGIHKQRELNRLDNGVEPSLKSHMMSSRSLSAAFYAPNSGSLHWSTWYRNNFYIYIIFIKRAGNVHSFIW